jgi:hypothetical protein
MDDSGERGSTDSGAGESHDGVGTRLGSVYGNTWQLPLLKLIFKFRKRLCKSPLHVFYPESTGDRLRAASITEGSEDSIMMEVPFEPSARVANTRSSFCGSLFHPFAAPRLWSTPVVTILLNVDCILLPDQNVDLATLS